MSALLIVKENNRYLLRIPKGKEVLTSLKFFCQEQQIEGGVFSGIGAVAGGEIGFFKPEWKDYKRLTFQENAELLSLLGNISKIEKKGLFLHAHAVLSREDGSSFGGHVFSLTVSATVEIKLEALSQPPERKFDDEIGLNLLQP